MFTRFYLADQINPVIMILVLWLFWPGLMFVTGWVFESRRIHLGKGQSRMFFPGDFMLSIAAVMLVGMHARNPVQNTVTVLPIYWVAGGVLHAFIALIVHSIDARRYPIGSRNSPTKIIHDFCGYFVCPWILCGLGFPQLIWCFRTSSFGRCSTEWVIFGAAAAFFISMTIWDLTHPASKSDLLLMHPDTYCPIWKRKK